MTTLEAMNKARSLGVTPSALHVLLVLIDDSPLLTGEVAKRAGIKSAGVTGIIDRMEKDDWIVRSHHPHDRRKIHVRPTERAYNLFLPVLEAEIS